MPWPSTDRLSANFTLGEFERGSLGGEVPGRMVPRLRELCVRLLQPIRDRWGRVRVTSGYRPGSDGSQHQRCEAADIHMVDAVRIVVWRWLLEESGLEWDQAIIYEDTFHMHLSYTTRRANRGEVRVHVMNPEDYGGRSYPLWSEYTGRLKDLIS